MAKKFIDPNWKALRKLDSRLRQAWFYIWDKSDACGMYEHDPEYMRADLGFCLTIEQLSSLPFVKKFSGEKILLLDYLRVNYGELKQDYNPHKPAFRAITKHGISNLVQAYSKLEEEDEKEDEAKKKKKDKGENTKTELIYPFHSIAFLERWAMWKTYKKEEHSFTYKSIISEQGALKRLSEISGGNEQRAMKIIESSISNGYKGLFETIGNGTGTSKNNGATTDVDALAESFQRNFGDKQPKS